MNEQTERNPRRREREHEGEFTAASESLIEKVVSINRVAKVVKGGRNFSFNAVVVVGDGRGRAGFGMGKANEVVDAITKATQQAKRALKRYPLVGTTLPHATFGKFGAGRVFLRPASPGTGVIAGGSVRLIMECLGVRDVLTKVMGTNNPHNVVKGVFSALDSMNDARMVAERRGISLREVFTI
ncbi:30S ribosomal protein S5 [candidate division KSB1 bacterium]|nr:MAG: 30S ribosomal protein S5 [candidate division KSB1 bacterium]